MDDLRSLEGVGHLLSEKMAQNKRKRTHKRSTSVPNTVNGTSSITSQTIPSNYIAISAQFPPQLAAALASGMNIGYYQKPSLHKSHSVFASKNIPKLDDNKSSGGQSQSQVTFMEQYYQPVISPQQSASPPLSPDAIHGLSLQNQFGSNRSSNRSSAHSRDLNALYRTIPESPSVRLSSMRGGGLQLDLTDVLVDEAITPRGSSVFYPFERMNSSGMPIIPSPDAISHVTPPEAGDDELPPILRRTYSNKSLFTLHAGDEMSSSTEDVLVASNTKLNSQIAPTHLPILETGNSSEMSIELESLDLKEDFMEYQNEQKDSFNNIGMGASGVVRKAIHFRSCKMVAIKQCRSKHHSLTSAFVKEAKIYRRFQDNPYIVNILGFGKDSDNGTLAMAMEYMDLGSCDSLKLDTLQVSVKQRELIVGHIIVNTLKALSELHSQLYVHNDIKPANILCNKYGEIKLSDFGTMLRMKDANRKLRINNGTQRYQSPEKLIGEPLAYSTKTDIWSLGVSAYELLFGTAYNSEDELAFVNNPPKLTTKQHGISSECCDFITKCLEIEDAKRLCASDLLQHEWLTKHVETIQLSREKWPWFIHTQQEIQIENVDEAIEQKKEKEKDAVPVTTDKKSDVNNGNKSKNKKVSFMFSANVTEQNATANHSDITQHHFYNEDLLFMISALIIYYSTQSLDLKSDSAQSLHRRQSNVNSKVKSYSDQERIENMAKYALCSQKMVVDRIKVTVAFIKSQINKLEKL